MNPVRSSVGSVAKLSYGHLQSIEDLGLSIKLEKDHTFFGCKNQSPQSANSWFTALFLIGFFFEPKTLASGSFAASWSMTVYSSSIERPKQEPIEFRLKNSAIAFYMQYAL